MDLNMSKKKVNITVSLLCATCMLAGPITATASEVQSTSSQTQSVSDADIERVLEQVTSDESDSSIAEDVTGSNLLEDEQADYPTEEEDGAIIDPEDEMPDDMVRFSSENVLSRARSATVAENESATNLINTGLSQLGNNGVKYNQWRGTPTNTAWCAIFIGWTAANAGIPADTIPHNLTFAQDYRNWFANRGLYTPSSQANPQPGDLFFEYNGSRYYHVGIVTGVSGGYISTVEGNTTDSRGGAYLVRAVRRKITSVAGYARPSYELSMDEGMDEGQIRGFVSNMFENTLGRSASEAEVNLYTADIILNGRTAASFVNDFLYHGDYTSRALSNDNHIENLYRAFLNRSADEGGKAHWVRRMNQGNSLRGIAREIVSSDEFSQLCENNYGGIPVGEVAATKNTERNTGVTSFVYRLYQSVLQRAPEENGMEDWTSRLLDQGLTANDAAQGFFESAEFASRQHDDSTFIELAYESILDRSSDPAGKQNWLNHLANGMSRSQMVYDFCNSPEFGSLAAQFGVPVV